MLLIKVWNNYHDVYIIILNSTIFSEPIMRKFINEQHREKDYMEF